MMMMRTQLTEQLRRETFEEMMRRRRDAEGYIIEGQGSPALLDSADDVEPIAEFVRQLVKRRRGRSVGAASAPDRTDRLRAAAAQVARLLAASSRARCGPSSARWFSIQTTAFSSQAAI